MIRTAVGLLILLASCANLPRDPENTFNRVRQYYQVRVGQCEHPQSMTSLTGEAFIVPRDGRDTLAGGDAGRNSSGTDWRLHDINVVPVRSVD